MNHSRHASLPCLRSRRPAPVALISSAVVLGMVLGGCATGAEQWSQVSTLSEIQGLFPSNVEPAVVYVADGHGLWRSSDYGVNFAPCGRGADLPGLVTALLIDPLRPQRLYAGTASQGVMISDDQGDHWQPCGPGLSPAPIHSLVFGPADRGCATLYATHGLDQAGLSESTDYGRSWHSFANDYSIADMVVLNEALFCAARNPAQGEGFFRYDATKGWYCVLPEAPRVVLASPASPSRLWFSSRDGGIAMSDNAGISTSRVGPPGIDVESMAIELTATGAETVYAFAPQSTGVIASSDGFATWHALTSGLEPSQWTEEGSRLAISCDGAALYACANGILYRDLRSADPAAPLQVRVLPAVLTVGGGPLLIVATARPGEKVVADLSSVGGPSAVSLHDDGLDGDEQAGDGRFTARLDMLPATVAPGSKVITVQATPPAGGAVRSGRATLRVLPAAEDEVLWDASRSAVMAARPHGGWTTTTRISGNGTPVLQLHCTGSGSLTLPLIGPWGEAVAVRDHALLCWAMRAAHPGAMPFQLSVHDNGQGSGPENAQVSQLVDLAHYLPQLDPGYQIVGIPLGDLLEGSSCSPALIDLCFTAGSAVEGDFELLPIHLLAQSGPTLGALTILPQGTHTLAVTGTAWGRRGCPLSASLRLGCSAQPLTLVGSLPEAAPTFARSWLDSDQLEESTPFNTVTLLGSIDTSGQAPGVHHAELVMVDGLGTTITSVCYTVPTGPLISLPGIAAASSDAERAEALSAAPTYQLGTGLRQLTAQLIWEPTALDLRLAVADPGLGDQLLPATTTPDTIGAGAQVELVLTTTAASAARRDVQVTWTSAGPRAWCDGVALTVTGRRTDTGYVVTLQAPIQVRPTLLPGPELSGREVRIGWTLTTSDHHLLTWKADPSPGADSGGVAQIEDPTGTPAWTLRAHSIHQLTLVADRPLEPAAASPGCWLINGQSPAAVVLASDRRQVLLFADHWPAEPLLITAPGLNAALSMPESPPVLPSTSAARTLELGAACR